MPFPLKENSQGAKSDGAKDDIRVKHPQGWMPNSRTIWGKNGKGWRYEESEKSRFKVIEKVVSRKKSLSDATHNLKSEKNKSKERRRIDMVRWFGKRSSNKNISNITDYDMQQLSTKLKEERKAILAKHEKADGKSKRKAEKRIELPYGEFAAMPPLQAIRHCLLMRCGSMARATAFFRHLLQKKYEAVKDQPYTVEEKFGEQNFRV